MKWLQICPVIHSLLKPGDHHLFFWWNSSKDNLSPGTPLTSSNNCVSDKPFLFPQPMPGLTTPIHPADSTWSMTLTPLLLKTSPCWSPLSFYHSHLENQNLGQSKSLPSCSLPKVSKHGCRKSIQLHGLQPHLTPSCSLSHPHFKINCLKMLSTCSFVSHHSSIILEPTAPGFDILPTFTKVHNHLYIV